MATSSTISDSSIWVIPQLVQKQPFRTANVQVAMALDMGRGALLSLDLQHPHPKIANPRVQIAGNFAPVPIHRLLLFSNMIPDCVNGVYLRNGTNP